MRPEITVAEEPLDALLERLCNGDDSAAEQVFLTYQPYLRMLVRRMLPNTLRPKFDSMDVVQSVWTDLVRGFREAGWRFSSAAQLRAFLVKVTRNRFIDRIRQNHTATEHQRSLETIAPELIVAPKDSPSETVEADELWERMLALCPPAHRRLLELKRQGCSLAEIAEQTGLHESSVRRILYDLARRLAVERE
jgi:RNA polymerase sigma-70 factor (ECF subfamily)